jgi:dihydrolipoamide dehydrogenase
VACIEKRGTLGGTCLNVGCIPSKSLLNNSHLYHQVLHDTKNRGIEVGDVKLNLAQMMKAKDTSVTGLTKGVEFLFKKNSVEYVSGTGAFVGEHEVKVNLTSGGEQTLRAKNIIIATGSEATPFPGLEIDEKKVITSTGAIALKEVPKKMVVIGGGIIGLEMGSVWSRLGSDVTVVEFLGQIGGPGMDAEISKQSQKILAKQGIKFKLNTKVLGGDSSGEGVKLEVEAAKGGKKETVSSSDIRDSHFHILTPCSSSTQTSSSLLLDVDHTPQASASKTSASRLTIKDDSSSTKNIAPSFLTSESLETAPLGPCWHTKPKKKA